MMQKLFLPVLIGGLCAIMYAQQQKIVAARQEQARLLEALAVCRAERQRLAAVYSGLNESFFQRELALGQYQEDVRESDCLLRYGDEGAAQAREGREDEQGGSGTGKEAVHSGPARISAAHDAALRLRYEAASAIGRGAVHCAAPGPAASPPGSAAPARADDR